MMNCFVGVQIHMVNSRSRRVSSQNPEKLRFRAVVPKGLLQYQEVYGMLWPYQQTGQLWTWGAGKKGQLGWTDSKMRVPQQWNKPVHIPVKEDEVDVIFVQVAAGAYHSAALSGPHSLHSYCDGYSIQ
nr:uncharacterized protein LOC129267604 [Lytechinus pictus]